MKTQLICPCGEYVQGKDEDDLVEKVKQHLRDKHPELADDYDRDHILFLAF
jgi:predicted small metal-binding protein